MPTNNLSIPPYYDDYDESKGFAKILFKPSVGIQTRELNQLQTILQKQVTRIGDHLFQQGSMIVPGRTSYDLNVRYIKIASTYNAVAVDYLALIGRRIKGATSECEFEVITAVADPDNSAVKVLIVKLVKAGGANNDVVNPSSGETIIDVLTVANVATVDSNTGYNGNSSLAFIDEGVFYTQGYFVKVLSQTLVLSLYTNTPTAKVGLDVIESIITSTNDTTLLDPAFGSSNENAPGADRLKIELEFTKTDINTPKSDSFIELMDFVNGQITFKTVKTEYAEVMKTLARRTFEESGNYTVKEFIPTLREHLLVTSPPNGGVYTSGQGGDITKFALQLSPGISFVSGYETETQSDTIIAIPKARDTEESQQNIIRPDVGNYFLIGNIEGFPNINARPYVELRNNSSVGTSPSTYTVIGYAVIDNVSHYYGTVGLTSAIHKARVSQVKLTAGGSVESVAVTNQGTGYTVTPLTVTGMTWSGGTVTVTINSHGLPTGRSVTIAGVTPSGYNGVYTITVTNANTFTYPLVSDPGTVSTQGTATLNQTVTFTGDGTGAAGTVTIAGDVVTGIVMSSGGSGYTYADITITAPAAGVTASGFSRLYFYDIEDVGSMAQVNLAGTTPFKADVLAEYTIAGNTGDFAGGTTYSDVSTKHKTKVHSWNSTNKLLYGCKTGVTTSDEAFLVGQVISNGTLQGTIQDKAILKNPMNNDMIFTLPFYPVKTIYNTNSVVDVEYIVNREYTLILNGSGAGDIVAGANETLAPFVSTEFVARITAYAVTAGHLGPVDLTNYITISSPTSYNVNMGVAYAGDTMKIIVPVKRLTPTFRTKTLVTNSEKVTLTANMSSYISLGKSDIYRIVGIWQKDDAAAVNTYADYQAHPTYYKDIKHQFTVNDGQRDSFITHGSIKLNQGLSLPTNDVLVVFDYFTSGPGEFFCVDSYSSLTSYLDLNPKYKSTSSNKTHSLYSSVDFRPVALPNVHEFSCNTVSGDATVTLDGSSSQSTNALTAGQSVIGQGIPVGATISSITNATTFELSANATVTRNKVILIFGGESGTGFLTKFKESIDYAQSNLRSNTDFRTDLQYYVPRVDSIYLTTNSTFEWIKGKPSSTPKITDQSSESKMRLFDVNIPAYTFDVKMISVKKHDRPVYTMERISNIEKRLGVVEEYTSLSLSEKKTKDMTIIDPATGLDRMKLGFGVDNFQDNSLADLYNSEYHAAMNNDELTVAPPILVRQCGLVKSNASTNVSFVGSHTIIDTDVSNPTIAMLPYTEVVVTSQLSASESKKINPFTTYSWQGSMNITPQVDIWTNIQLAPDVSVQTNF